MEASRPGPEHARMSYAQGTVNGKIWTYRGENAMGGRAFQTRYTITEANASSYDFKRPRSRGRVEPGR